MELLLPESSLWRIEPSLKRIAPDLSVTTLTSRGTFERDGVEVPAASVEPDIVWLAPDAATDGSLPALLERITGSTKTRWVQSFLAGHDRPVFQDILRRGVRLSKSTASAISIAEYVMAHVFSQIVPIEEQRAAQQARLWKQTPFREIGDRRWTVVGYGAIGTEVGKRVKAFGAHVTAVRRRAGGPAAVDAVISLAELKAVLPQTDVIVLACALNDETRHLADERFFDELREKAILVNVGRGGLIDADALRRGLERDRPSHAILDVFEEEPLPADSWMWDHPKVRVTGHTSAYGTGTYRRNDEQFLTNLSRFLAEESGLDEISVPVAGG